MTTPLPWSPSSLDSFVSCPRSFHEQRVLKNFRQEQGEEAKWGEMVHKHFENYINNAGYSLPDYLHEHKDYLDFIRAKPGKFACEYKVAMTKQLKPCQFLADEVWFRGVIDFKKIGPDGVATLVDYKTGKPHTKFKQLSVYAIHTFAMHANVHLINAQYYWTKTGNTTKKVWNRADVRELWAELVPDLKQYKEAFQTDVWQPRQSGLCNGWCPVTTCEYWRPRRSR